MMINNDMIVMMMSIKVMMMILIIAKLLFIQLRTVYSVIPLSMKVSIIYTVCRRLSALPASNATVDVVHLEGRRMDELSMAADAISDSELAGMIVMMILALLSAYE
jgi:hypothetical protein